MQAQLSLAEIVSVAEKLDSKNFDILFKKLSAIRTNKFKNTSKVESEDELFLKIQKPFPIEKYERLKYLDWKSEFGKLTKKEEIESLRLAQEYEEYSVERLKIISKLAILKNISIDEFITHKKGFA